MRALLLAAGVGSRLKPYTDLLPKPMLSIGGRPILAYNLEMLAAGGFDDIVVNLHAFPDSVRDFIGDGSRFGVHVTYSHEVDLRGTAGALVPMMERFASETFAIVFGDNLNDLDLVKMTAHHRSHQAVATLALWQREDVSHSGVVELGPDDRIERFIEKPRTGESDSRWVNAGVVLAEPSLLESIPLDIASDLGRDIFPSLIARGARLYGYRAVAGHWWFDRVADYEAASTDHALRRFADKSAMRDR